MPHAGTDVPCYRSYSSDLRERVVYQRCTLKYKIKEISTSLNMSQRVVEWVLKLGGKQVRWLTRDQGGLQRGVE